MRDRTRYALLGAFLLALVAVYIAGRSSGGGGSLGESGVVAGLGDSVAAGYGLGPSSGYPDNPLAYPLVLADRLGWEGFDFAIEGACALSVGDPQASPDTADACTRSVLSDQLPLMGEVLAGPPEVITLSIGANDVRWAECIMPVLSPVPLPFVPCASDVLGQRLAALRHNLGILLEEISGRYPDARIMVTEYYNPAPAPPTADDGSDVCTLFEPLALLRQPDLLLQPVALRSGAGVTQAEAHAVVAEVLSGLNGVIREVAGGAGVETVPVDFGDHDMCRSQTGGSAEDAWAYGPSVQVEVTLEVPPAPTTTTHWDVTLPGACPDRSLDSGPYPLPAPLLIPSEGAEMTMDATFLPNCSPHPTATGQEAIAEAVLEALEG